MSEPVAALRVIDTGVRAGRRNVALDQALIEAHRQGLVPDTLRFLQFEPCVLLGRHQCVSAEVDIAYCTAHGIQIGRRITGGGALYLDTTQLGWELVCQRQNLPARTLAGITELICGAAAAGLRRLGVAAQFRPRNDIEVDGRKISGTGGFFDGDTIFFQGTLLIDVDPANMWACLRLPEAKLARHAAAQPAARVVGLRELLGGAVPPLATIKSSLVGTIASALGARAESAVLSPQEMALADGCYHEEIGSDEFVHGLEVPARGGYRTASTHCAGGTVTVFARTATRGTARLDSVLITGDFFVTPPRVMFDLEAWLRDTPLLDIERRVGDFFAVNRPELLSISPAELAATIRAALPAPPGAAG